MSASVSHSSAAVHAPRQERSRRTLERIVLASLDLIGEQGVEATTVQQIVKRANSSVGSFYARFDGKESLLDYLEERLWQDALERWEDALESAPWDGLGLGALARPVVRLLLDTTRMGERQRRVLAARHPSGAGPDPARSFHVSLRRGLRGELLARADEIRHPDPSLAVDVALRVVVGAIRETEDATLDGALPGVDEERLVAELTRLLLAYLGADGSSGEAIEGQIEFFDVWG